MAAQLLTLDQVDLTLLSSAGNFFESPIAWEDQIFYFMMLDRFSDGKENGYKDNQGNVVAQGTTPLFKDGDHRGNAVDTEAKADQWRKAGGKYVGGTLKGLQTKIGYLKRLGITAVWISPVFKQVKFQETYHGYGIQNFLDVDPHFGTREDLKELVRIAHENGIYVILDIILNHVGDVFSYESEAKPWDGQVHPVKGFNNSDGKPTLPFQKTNPKNSAQWPGENDAIWPVEFQDPAVFTQKGYIKSWDFDPEFREGDFFDLKDVIHGQGEPDTYQASPALQYLCEVYNFWIAYADLDGFRIDTVKHMDIGATRFFASSIHEFSQSIGKEKFFLVGEITGGRQRAFQTQAQTGLDAALGIDEIPDKLEYLVKGFRNPSEYFDLFRNSLLINKDSNTWFRDKVVTMYDDHDQVRKGQNKGRFCFDSNASKVALNALVLNALTLGIPCVYYGSEQGFDGNGNGDGADRYIREAMFGGEFGAFRTKGVHFFDESNQIYQELSKILAIRKKVLALRRGRQYLREISAPTDGVKFGVPTMIGGQIRSIIPWSRVLSSEEVVLAINTDYNSPSTAWVTVDNLLHQTNAPLTCLYSTDPAQLNQSFQVEAKNGKAILLTVPPAGFVIVK
jgi:glycosidase